MFASRLALLIMIFCLGAGFAPDRTSPEFCDSSLTYTRTDAYGYFARPGRCEGRFRKRNSGDFFFIAGYISGTRTVSVSSTRAIRLSWPRTGANTVKIRANSLLPSVPYQMDTRVASPIQEFSWPTDVLRGLRLDIGVLGLRASVVQGPPERRDSVLIPVRVIDGTAPESTPRLVIYSVSALKEIHLSIRDPQTQRLLLRPTISTSVPALQPYEIAIPAELPPGRYHAEIGAILASGAPATADADILVPARADAP